MKIGLLGGTFDPIHIGHLVIANWIREDLGLEKVIFIPTGNPPHKLNCKVTDIKDRLEMVRLAINDNSHFEISDIEIRNEKISYTVNTLREFSETGNEIYYIIGEDSLKELPKWKNPEEILKLSYIVTVRRPNVSKYKIKFRNSKKIIFFDSLEISISSTQIRERVKEGKSIKYLVHPAVEKYIKEKGLYKIK